MAGLRFMEYSKKLWKDLDRFWNLLRPWVTDNCKQPGSSKNFLFPEKNIV